MEKQRSAQCGPEYGSYQSSVSNKDLSLDQEEQRGNRITLIFVKIVYKKNT